MALNLLAASIPIAVLQLVILPSLAEDVGSDQYGLLVTILALLNVIPSTIGNVLNNIRILYDNKYRESGFFGDFQLIHFATQVISLILVLVISSFYDKNMTWVDFLLLGILSVFWLSREYYIAAFRIKIDYTAILINNILLVVGYVIGFLLFKLLHNWIVIYISGYTLSLAYIFIKTDIWKERLGTTPFFRFTTVQVLLLFISNLLLRITTYADKLLIYPLLGGTIVAIYYAATIFGKVISMVITPVSGVILTYLSKTTKKNNNLFLSLMFFGAIVSIVGYIGCLVVSRPVLSLIYPQFVTEAMNYIPITSATAILMAFTSLINPFIMKYFNMWWQIVINGSTTVFYVLICLGLLHFYGLTGFCIGAMITNIIKLIFMIFIFMKCRELDVGESLPNRVTQ